MKRNLLTVLSIGAMFVLFLSGAVFAQDGPRTSTAASKFVISAEAGGVNFVKGRVTVTRKVGRSGYLLKGDTVKIGERISTAEDGKVEVLLNPGSYIRLGGDSSFEFLDTSLDNLQIKLHSGSAMFEVITSNDFAFAINTPKATFNVVKSGVYRVDVLEDGTGKMEVRKGRALVGDDEDAKIKKGRSATVDGDDVAMTKFDRGEKDDLEMWSRDRAKELDKINDRLERQRLRNTLITGFAANRWNFYDSFGLWILDPYYDYYCFLPFGYGWSSPYGFRYGRDIWWFRLPRYIYFQPPPPRYPTGNPNATTTPPNNTSRNPGNTGRRAVPPFQTVDRDNSRERFPNRRMDPTNIDTFPTRTLPSGVPSPPSNSDSRQRQPTTPPMQRTRGRDN
ncbi:MAG: FecR family protein [Pyrinomonadaceae bacterium]